MDLSKIGQCLREKREELGLSTEGVAQTTCVRRIIIESIESGDWSALPHEVYVKGFIKDYASYLNIYNEIAPYLSEKKDDQPASLPVREESPPLQDKSWYRRPLKPTVVYPVIIALLIGFYIMERAYKDRESISKLENIEQISEISTNSHIDKNTPTIADLKRLAITCNERTWISIVTDNNEKKEMMLNPNDIIVVGAKERFDLLIGNAGGIKLVLNGRDTGFTGKSGEVKRVKLP